jgi:hypothetical protein
MTDDVEFKMFIPLTKVDEEKRLVYGIATAEAVDRSGEICDYSSTKPHYEKWSSDMSKASGGKSLGNVRVMHSKVAAGKLVKLFCNDEAKQIEVCAKIVDDNEWNKVLEGVYTGFSHGGGYVRKWKDPDDPTKIRYTGRPSELSLVDIPCLGKATFFQVQKMDGTTEMRKFHGADDLEKMIDSTPELEQDIEDMIMVVSMTKALAVHGDVERWDEFADDAAQALSDALPAVELEKFSDDQPRDSTGKWVAAGIGAAVGGAKGAALGALTAGTPGAIIGGVSGAISGALETSDNAAVRASGEILSAVTSAVGVGAIASRMMSARKTMDAAVSGVKAVVGAAETGQSASEAVKNLTDPTARGHAEQFIDKARDEAMRQFESAQSDIDKAKTKAQRDFDAAVKRQAAKMKSDKAAAEARSNLRTVRGSKKDEAEKAVETGDMKKMSITNDMVLAKAAEMAVAAGKPGSEMDYLEQARAELEKGAEPEQKPNLEKRADERDPTKDWGAKQVWQAKDGSIHEKKADALAKNAEIDAGQNPLVARLDKALGKSADEPTTEDKFAELRKYLGEEVWNAQRAMEALNTTFSLLMKEMSEQEQSPEQVASLQKAIDGLKAFIVSEIQEDNSDPMARVAKMLDDMGELAKVGARNSARDLEVIQKIHDHTCDLGGACKVMDKSADADDLAKRAGAYDALAPRVEQLLAKSEEQAEIIRKQGETIEAMKKMAAPPPRLHVVEKSGEITITNASTDTKTVEAEFAKLSQEDKALLMVKLAQSNPQKMGSVG